MDSWLVTNNYTSSTPTFFLYSYVYTNIDIDVVFRGIRMCSACKSGALRPPSSALSFLPSVCCHYARPGESRTHTTTPIMSNDIDDNHDMSLLHWWARSSVNIYPDLRVWTTTTMRWGISTQAWATPDLWPVPCLRIGMSTTLRRKMTMLVQYPINTYVGTEIISRPHTQLETRIRLMRSSWKAKIYQEWSAIPWRSGQSGSTIHQKALAPDMPAWQSLHSNFEGTTSMMMIAFIITLEEIM